MSVVRLARRAMATLFEVTVVTDDDRRGRAAAEAALDEIAAVEREISLFLPTSEISRINRIATRRPLSVEPRLYALLEAARDLSRQTGGAFDITVGELMRARGFRDDPALGVAAALATTGWRGLRLESGTIRLERAGAALDLGGIGKGYAIDRAADRLRRLGISQALLHGGWSTVFAVGKPPEGDGWSVGLVDPARPDQRFGSLALADRALSVSAVDGRTAEVEGETRSHIVDPRGGEARRRIAWATAPSAASADALSTAFLLQPAEEIRALCRERGYGAILLEPEPRVFGVEIDRFEEPRRRTAMSRRDFLGGTAAAAAAAAAFAIGLPDRLRAEPRAVEELRLGVVGLGAQGTLLLSLLTRIDGVHLQAVCDTRQSALDEALGITGRNVETYLDHRHLLDVERLDGLVVATPTDTHRPICLDAIAAGTGVFCEAPLASSVEGCHALAEAAAASDVVFQVGHQRRWNRLYPHALTHIRGGSIGDIVKLEAQWNRRTSWRRPVEDPEDDPLINWRLARRRSGGLLLEQGSHSFDLANWFLGATPDRVTGFGSTRQWKDGRDIDDTVHVLLVYPGEIQVSFSATLASSYGEDREHLYGTAGTILLLHQSKGLLFKEPDSAAAGWETFAERELLGERHGILLDPQATVYTDDEPERPATEVQTADVYAELSAFLESLRGGEAPRCSAKEGAIAAITALVALDAVRTGRVAEYSQADYAL